MSASSLTQALGLILHGPPIPASPEQVRANSEIVILDYRDPATFSALWLNGLESDRPTINDETFDWIAADQQILIIGNDPPDEVFQNLAPSLRGINFRSHLTATSWLAAWKVKFTPSAKERLDGKFEPMACFAVVNSCEAGLDSGTSRALQTILGAHDAPSQSLVPRATVLSAPSLESICRWLEQTKADTRPTQDHLLDLLKSTIWNELTSNREQHHALSNVLGAFLFSNQVGKGEEHIGEPWVQDYLLALVQSLGVEANLNQIKVKEHKGFQRWITAEQQKDIESIVLIDDMAGIWDYFLRGATGFAGNTAFDSDSQRTYRESLDCFGGTSFPEEIGQLPGRLGKFLESDRRRLRAVDLLGSPTKIGENFVLFLDLRLFAAADAALAKGYDEELKSLGKRILAATRLSRPWLDAGTFSRLEEELDGEGGHPRETLLPRLISLLDPTLPIVIFSSSHRTELIGPFRNFGNIIVDFRKPVLTGMSDWPAMVKETYSGFHSAMTAAAAILTTRRYLAKLEPVETTAV